jgi:SAM-dependent methyltransferase
MEPEKLYDRTSGIYDRRHMLAPSSRWLKRHEDPIIRKLKGRTLDIGCGTGYDLRLLGDAVGIDPSEEMLKIARKTGKKVVLGKAEHLPFGNGSFDNAVCLFGTLNMCDHVKAVREMSRVVKPEGTAVVSVASVWDRGHGLLKRFGIRHPAKDKMITIDGSRMRIVLFDKTELISLFRKNGFALKKFIPLFKYQNPRWGNWEPLPFQARLRLWLDRIPVFGKYGAMYIMVFKKTGVQ